jgi:hypothetical protein
MVGSLLLPAAPLSLSLFSSPSRPSHAWREHWRQCSVCKTLCMVKLAVPIYVNHHTSCCCGGRGRKGGGEDCCCCQCQHHNDPDSPWGCVGDGWKGATTGGCVACASPPQVNGSNNGDSSCGGVLCSLPLLMAGVAV